MILLRVLPGFLFLAMWEIFCRLNPEKIFFFGLPSKIFEHLISKTIDGSLPLDFAITLLEATSGLVLGTLFGAAIGLSFWFSPNLSNLSKPYIVAFGAIPVFALAPLFIIWFGIGLLSKVMIVAASTFFVALYQSYMGVQNVDANQLRLVKSMGGSRIEEFRKVVIPTALLWVMSAMKMNVSLSLLGAFIGEYISSTRGLGHLILVASGLFDISLVLAGVVCLMAIALIFNCLIERLELPLKRIAVQTL